MIFAGCFFAVLYALHLISLMMVAWRCRRHPVLYSNIENEGITLVRPLCGLETFSRETLETSFIQQHQKLEVVFCVGRENDAIVPLVRELMVNHPDVRSSLLFGEERLGQNPKLNNMAKGWQNAAFDTVVFADSNLMLPVDYCCRVLNGFDEDVAVVSSPPIGSNPDGIWGEVECAMLNTHAARWQYAAAAIGMGFAQGKTLAFKKTFGRQDNGLQQDLMRALAQEPAEDAAATKLARMAEKKVGLLAPPFSQPIGRRSFQAVWARHVRWARLRRATFGPLFALEIFTGIFLPLMALIYMFSLIQLPVTAALIVGVTLWYVPEILFAWYVGWHVSWLSYFIRDMLLPVFYVAGWSSSQFVWHGHPMTGGKGSAAPFMDGAAHFH